METISLERQARHWLLENGLFTIRQADLVILLKNVQEQAREEDKMWIDDATEPLKQELESIKNAWSRLQDLMTDHQTRSRT